VQIIKNHKNQRSNIFFTKNKSVKVNLKNKSIAFLPTGGFAVIFLKGKNE